MNVEKLYDVAEEMGLEIRRFHPNIWQCKKRNRNGVFVPCLVKYDKHSKYYELIAVANECTLYYGLSFDDLISEIKEFYRINGTIIPKEIKENEK